jgi:hypothetical protein
MTPLHALAVVENKFWIVEHDGAPVGTIQSVDEYGAGVVFVYGSLRERHRSIGSVATQYNIVFGDVVERAGSTTPSFNVHGYPCDARPYNQMLKVQDRLPMYTKVNNSRSYFCAGYYLINYAQGLMLEFCPKHIILKRHGFHGPFASSESAVEHRNGMQALPS